MGINSAMRALVLHAPRDLRLEDVDERSPGNGWVKVRVRRVGICGTDKSIYLGDYAVRKLPIILGHEISGEVVEVGEGVDERIIGQRVTSEINLSCGECSFCKRGLREHCLRREALGISLDGGMADYVLTRADLLHTIGDLNWLQGAFIEPLAAALKPFFLMPPPPSSSIAVVGVGTIGLLSVQISALFAPKRLVAISRRRSRKSELAEIFGAESMTVEEALNLKGEFDLVVEASGSPNGLEIALNLTRPRGTIFAKSTHGKEVSFDYTRAVVNEVIILGSRCGPFDAAIELLRKGKVRVDELVTSVYKLEDGVEAFIRSLDPDELKVQLEP